MLFNPDLNIGQVGNTQPTSPQSPSTIDANTPQEWFSDLDSGSQLPIRYPVAPDFGNEKGLNERVNTIIAHLFQP